MHTTNRVSLLNLAELYAVSNFESFDVSYYGVMIFAILNIFFFLCARDKQQKGNIFSLDSSIFQIFCLSGREGAGLTVTVGRIGRVGWVGRLCWVGMVLWIGRLGGNGSLGLAGMLCWIVLLGTKLVVHCTGGHC